VTLVLIVGTLAAQRASYYQTGDFFCLWSGARSLVLGHDPYDVTWWTSLTGGLFADPWRGLATSSCTSYFAYPLWTAVVLLPLGALPLELAASLWMALSIGAVIFGMDRLWRAYAGRRENAALFAALVVGSQPFWVLLVGGQLTGILLGIAGAVAAAIRRGSDVRAGAALALLALKPQLVVVTLPAMLLRLMRDGRRRAAVTAVVVGLAMTLVPLLFVGAWPQEWLGAVGPQRLRVAGLFPTAWGFAADVLGNVWWAVALIAALVALVMLIARDVDVLALFALSFPLSLVVTPHAWSYDFLLLAVPWAFVLGRLPFATRVMRRALLGALLLVASPLPWVLYGVGFARGLETVSVLVPAATALLAATATRQRRSTAA